jgi:polysaccharide biosynthesis protein PslA
MNVRTSGWSAAIGAPRKSGVIGSKRALRFNLYVLLVSLDCFALFAGFCLAGRLRFGSMLHAPVPQILMLVLPVFAVLAVAGQSYCIAVLRSVEIGIGRALRALAFTIFISVLVAFFVKSSADFSRFVVAVGFPTGIVFLVINRLLVDRMIKQGFGGNFVDELVLSEIPHFELPHGVRFIDAKAAGVTHDGDDPIMLDQLSRALRYVDRVVVACPPENEESWGRMLKGFAIQAEILSSRFEMLGVSGIGHFGGEPTLIVNSGPLGLANRILKRTLDLAVTVPVLIFLMPALFIVALLIKLDSPGPVFFKQQRMGEANRLFMIYKFRSMKSEMADANGSLSASRTDSRVTKFGRFLRRSSIDELPQLINVLIGDMSLVGPRPHALGSTAEDALFWEIAPDYWKRHALKPGITGLAQIRGLRGATEKVSDLTKRVEADLEYVANWSLMRDMLILLSTFKVIIHPDAF